MRERPRFVVDTSVAVKWHLADANRCPLVYADRRLRNQLGDRFPRAFWIGDYASRRA